MEVPFMQWLIIPAAAGLVTFLYQLLRPLLGREAPMERLGRFVDPSAEEAGEEKKPRRQEYRQGIGVLARGIARSGMFGNYRANLRKTLVRANILMKPEEFIAFQVVAFLIGFLVGLMAVGPGVLPLATALAGLSIPSVMVRRRIRNRLKLINTQLGDTIAILSNALKAGHSFFQAVDSVSREMSGPIAEEFIKLQKEINFGVNTETALENMVARVGSDDLELMVTAVLIQRQIGGNLAQILDNISSTIRQPEKMKGEITTLTAQARMSGWVIGGLPFVLAGMMAVMSPEQLKLLVSDPLGYLLIGIALVSEGIGIILVKKIVSVEV
jgi:tight adherence protein B